MFIALFPTFCNVSVYFFEKKEVPCGETPRSNLFPLNLHFNQYAPVAIYHPIVKGGER